MKRGENKSGYVDFWAEAHRKLSEKYESENGQLAEALLAFQEETPAEKILHHVSSELDLRPSDESLDKEYASIWHQLEYRFENALASFENNDISKACWNFYWMGVYAQQLQEPTSKELHLAYKADREKFVREMPLMKKSNAQKTAKKVVQNLAQELWKTEEYRLTDMANYIWKLLVDWNYTEKLKELPNDANGLKPWLREIAPDFAKKGGAPKK